MPGKYITDQQIRVFMNERKHGKTQTVAAAKGSGVGKWGQMKLMAH